MHPKGVSLTTLDMSVKTARETRLQVNLNNHMSVEARLESGDGDGHISR